MVLVFLLKLSALWHTYWLGQLLRRLVRDYQERNGRRRDNAFSAAIDRTDRMVRADLFLGTSSGTPLNTLWKLEHPFCRNDSFDYTSKLAASEQAFENCSQFMVSRDF